MTKHLNDTLQQRHLEYIHARAAAGRAETAPELSNVEENFDNHYLLGTVFPAAPLSILENTGIDIIEKEKRESGDLVSSESCDRQLPLRHSAISMRSNSSSGRRRRKSVQFSPLVAVHEVVPYSQVYGMHPNQFHFDACGNRIVGAVQTTPVPPRESHNVSADHTSTVEPICSVGVLHRNDSSHEEECRSSTSRSVASNGSAVRHSQAEGQANALRDTDRCILSRGLKPPKCRAPASSRAPPSAQR